MLIKGPSTMLESVPLSNMDILQMQTLTLLAICLKPLIS